MKVLVYIALWCSVLCEIAGFGVAHYIVGVLSFGILALEVLYTITNIPHSVHHDCSVDSSETVLYMLLSLVLFMSGSVFSGFAIVLAQSLVYNRFFLCNDIPKINTPVNNHEKTSIN